VSHVALTAVRTDVASCLERVNRLERTIERLRTEVDRLHEKMRS